MITRGLIALVLAAAAGAVVVAAAAAPAVSLKVGPKAIVYGQEVRLSGKIPAVRGGQRVIVRARACRFTKAVPVRTLKTQKNGSFSFRVGPTLKTIYSVSWGKRVSRKLTVGVAPQMTLRKTGVRTYPISVSAGGGSSFEGMQVQLQRRVGKKWRIISVTTLKLTSAPTALTAVSSGTAMLQKAVPKRSLLRAVFPLYETKPCYRAGISTTLRT